MGQPPDSIDVIGNEITNPMARPPCPDMEIVLALERNEPAAMAPFRDWVRDRLTCYAGGAAAEKVVAGSNDPELCSGDFGRDPEQFYNRTFGDHGYCAYMAERLEAAIVILRKRRVDLERMKAGLDRRPRLCREEIIGLVNGTIHSEEFDD